VAVEELARHWVAALNYAMTTGDTEALQAASRGCDGCDEYVNLYRGIYSAGGLLRTKGWTPTFLQVDAQRADRATVLLEVRAAPSRYKLTNSQRLRSSGESRYELRLETRRFADGWAVTSLANA
jgi:hypothetical protein